MASIQTTGSGGRRKSLNADLNLVPFIDLLSTCICFLLVTAIWIQIGSINVKQLVGSQAAQTDPHSYELAVKFLSPEKLELAVTGHALKGKSHFIVSASDSASLMPELEKTLAGFVPLFHLPQNGDVKAEMGKLFSSAKITTKAGVPYGELVSVLDALRHQGIINLGVVPVKE